MARRDKRTKGKLVALRERAVDYAAGRMHDAWRRQFMKDNPEAANQPRLRMRQGKMVDVNQPWERLDPAAKQDNKLAAYDAYAAVERFPKNREKAAAFVHAAWVKRNRADPNQPPGLFKPYAELSEVEKDKDRAHVDEMKDAVAAVTSTAERKRKKAKNKKKAKKKPPPLALDAALAERLEAAAAALSKATGAELSAEALLAAAAEAVLAICDAAAPARPRNKR